MKERPILFSGEMVRAILGGKKTQTRRVFSNPPRPDIISWERWSVGGDLQYRDSGMPLWVGDNEKGESFEYGCPYGEVGERLWVRETWQSYMDVTAEPDFHRFENCKTDPVTGKKYIIYYRAMYGEDGPDGWSSSIHMPRWASRITLEITDVRVERLQDISEEDARAEGIRELLYEASNGNTTCYNVHTAREIFNGADGTMHATAREAFSALWDGINKERGHSWESNPWVWAITFKRVESEATQ